MASSWFDGVVDAPLPPALALFQAYARDTNQEKANLIFGSYHDDEGRTMPLPVVKEVEKLIVNDPNDTYDYLNAAGLESFTRLAADLVFGPDHPLVKANRIVSIQTISGTNALHFAARFLSYSAPLLKRTVYLAKETWGNHAYVFQYGGVENIKYYRYCDFETMGLDLAGMLEDLRNAEPGSIVVLQPCSHNPTGIDPTKVQWHEILKAIRTSRLFPIWDCAFHGFASGDLNADVWPIRFFADHGIEFMVAQTFSKIFCLDSHRPGNLIVVANTSQQASVVKSHLVALARSAYNNPPSHGARIVSTILGSPAYKEQWEQSVRDMVDRIKRVRKMLQLALEEEGALGSWKHITEQTGLFCFTGLSEEQTDYLVKNRHVYIQKSGRLNICGINEGNVGRVARAISEAVRTQPLDKLTEEATAHAA